MDQYDFDIPVTFRHRIRFTKNAFAIGNPVVRDLFEPDRACRVLVYVESAISRLYPELKDELATYLGSIDGVQLCSTEAAPRSGRGCGSSHP